VEEVAGRRTEAELRLEEHIVYLETSFNPW